MWKKLLIAVGIFFIPRVTYADIFFSQNFSSSTTVSDYANLLAPSLNQFNGIQTSGTGTTITIANDDLVFTRVSGNAASANRTALNGVIPITASLVTFNLSAGGVAGTNAGQMSLGSGADFGTQVGAPANTNIHSRIGINTTATGFSLRDIGTLTNSTAFTGNQVVSWYTNNSGATINYVNPMLGTTALANDFSDLWVGTTRVLTVAAQTGIVDITSFKFSTNFGTTSGQFIAFDSIQIEDLVISAVPEPTSIALVGLLGCTGLIAYRRRKSKAKVA